MNVAENFHLHESYREAGFKRIPVVAMILLQILTWGFYSYYWYLSRKKAINHLNTERRFPFWYNWSAAVTVYIFYFLWLYMNSNGILFFNEDFVLFCSLVFMAVSVANHIINRYRSYKSSYNLFAGFFSGDLLHPVSH